MRFLSVKTSRLFALAIGLSCTIAPAVTGAHVAVSRAQSPTQSSADGGEQSPGAAPVYRQPRRLSRSGTPASSSKSRPFSLGAEQQHSGDAPLHTGVIDQAFPSVATPLRAAAGSQDNSGQAPYALQTGQEGGNIPTLGVGERNMPTNTITAKVLANYDIELIVDQSASMHTPDCPGWQSRWDWCGMQAHQLAIQLSPFVPKGLTITNFSHNYDVHQNASPQNIADLFNSGNLGMGTRLAEPLNDRLNSYFAHFHAGSKPMLIAIITDGEPTPRMEPRMVADALIAASKRVQDPRQLTVVFFQIGGFDMRGRAFLDDLDNNLVSYGARYDIVRTVGFERLQQVGLAQGLVDSIHDFAKQQSSRPHS